MMKMELLKKKIYFESEIRSSCLLPEKHFRK